MCMCVYIYIYMHISTTYAAAGKLLYVSAVTLLDAFSSRDAQVSEYPNFFKLLDKLKTLDKFLVLANE